MHQRGLGGSWGKSCSNGMANVPMTGDDEGKTTRALFNPAGGQNGGGGETDAAQSFLLILTDSAWAWSPSASAIVSTMSPIVSRPSRLSISTEAVLQK